MRPRHFVHLLLNGGLYPWDKLLSFVIGVIIVGNLALFIVSTEEAILAKHDAVLSALEAASVAIFTVEYLLRMWVCVERDKYGRLGPIKGRLRFGVSFLSLVDLLAIVPFYILLVVGSDAEVGFLSAVRIIRVVRLLKLEKWTRALRVLRDVFSNNYEVLLMTLFLGLMLMFTFSTLLYLVENERYPSIPSAIYMATLMVTGQNIPEGPLSFGGQVVTAIGAVASVLVFALPAGILGWGFEPIGEAFQASRERRKQKSEARLEAAKEHGYVIVEEEDDELLLAPPSAVSNAPCPTCGQLVQ